MTEFQINPMETSIDKLSSTLLEFILKPKLFPKDTETYDFQFFVIGDIKIDDKYKYKNIIGKKRGNTIINSF